MGRLEEALEFLDIEEWLEEYAETKYGGTDEIRIQDCPKCFNDKWKVYINVEKRIWFCQRCQWGHHNGDICSLLAAVSGKNIHVVRMEIARAIVPATTDSDFTNKLAARLNGVEILEEFSIEPIDLPGELGLDGRSGEKATEYLVCRGLTEEDIEHYQLRLSSKLRNNLGPWAVFPVNYYGIPVACQGRKFLNDSDPKYLSSDAIGEWLWPLDKSNLENIEKGIVVLVEGVFDALAYIKAGVPALCTFGKNLTRPQLKLLQSHGVKKVYLSYDADAHKDIRKAADRVRHLFSTFIVELTPLPENPKADPGDVLSGKVDSSWLLDSLANAIDTMTPEYWEWQLRKELGV